MNGAQTLRWSRSRSSRPHPKCQYSEGLKGPALEDATPVVSSFCVATVLLSESHGFASSVAVVADPGRGADRLREPDSNQCARICVLMGVA